ncbi:unnamed protein product, partial [Rotaria magnacalcarata]
AAVRPSSAAKTTDGTASNDASNAVTSQRPASASVAAVSGSRPPSAAKKSEVSAASNIASAPPGSRPPSASVGAAAAGSRPSSALKKTDDVTATYTIVEQDATLPKIDPNDPNITQPIIGRPPGAAKNLGTEEAIATLAGSATASPKP